MTDIAEMTGIVWRFAMNYGKFIDNHVNIKELNEIFMHQALNF